MLAYLWMREVKCWINVEKDMEKQSRPAAQCCLYLRVIGRCSFWPLGARSTSQLLPFLLDLKYIHQWQKGLVAPVAPCCYFQCWVFVSILNGWLGKFASKWHLNWPESGQPVWLFWSTCLVGLLKFPALKAFLLVKWFLTVLTYLDRPFDSFDHGIQQISFVWGWDHLKNHSGDQTSLQPLPRDHMERRLYDTKPLPGKPPSGGDPDEAMVFGVFWAVW